MRYEAGRGLRGLLKKGNLILITDFCDFMCMRNTKNNSKIILSVAFSYGGRSEIVQAVRKIISQGIEIENIDESLFEKYLTTYGIPDPDIIVRTAGEMRLSNFLIWQSAYSEYYFTDVLWPDFGEDDVESVIESFSSRSRRFGKS